MLSERRLARKRRGEEMGEYSLDSRGLELLASVLHGARDTKELEAILGGLLTNKELHDAANRARITWLIEQGLTYDEITETMRVSKNTIALVSHSNRTHGQAFVKALYRRPKLDASDPLLHGIMQRLKRGK